MVRLQCEAGDVEAARRVYNDQLRPRTRIADRRRIEAYLVAEELTAALELRKEGRTLEAAMMLIESVEATETGSVRDLIAKQAIALDIGRGYRQYIDVVRLSRAGQYEEALEGLESIDSSADDPAFLERVELMRVELQAMMAAEQLR